MSGHHIRIDGDDDCFQAVCSCRQRSRVVPRWQDADDWRIEHKAEVERVKAHLRRGVVSPRQARDYYQSQADNDLLPADVRAQWARLAEELTHRVDDNAPPDEGQGQLW